MVAVEIIVPVVLFLSVAAVLIVYRKFTNEERIALVEKGADAKMFNKDSNARPVLRFALLFIGAGIGLLVGTMLDDAGFNEDTAYFSMIFLFGGLGLLIAYLIERKDEKKKE